MFDRAELKQGDKVLREAAGTVTKRGRPRVATPKRQVSVRLDPAILDELKRANPKWQVAMMDVLDTWAKQRRAKRLGKAEGEIGATASAMKKGVKPGAGRRRAALRKTGA